MDFFNKYKKIFLIIGFIGVVILIGFLIYTVFFKQGMLPGPGGEQTATSTQTGGFPQAKTGPGQTTDTGNQGSLSTGQKAQNQTVNPIATGGLTETTDLTDSKSSGVTLNTEGNFLQYYNKDDGKFYQIDKNGQSIELSDKIFTEAENITWSPNSEKAIIEFPDGANIVYDFTTKKQITLPNHWKDYGFSASGDKIISKSMGIDPDNRFLIVANDDGSDAKVIEPMGENEEYVDVGWSPNNQVVATYREGIDFDRQNIYFVGLNKENFKSLVVEGRGFQSLWSPKGEQMLYSVYSTQTDLKPLLWITDAIGNNIGNNRRNLNIQTWAEKCTFYDDITVYCAVPKELEEGAGLYPELAESTIDQIYRIDVSTGQSKLVAIPDNDFTVTKIIISADGRYLYFTDRLTEKIHKINLK